jgi:hypothetical protein
MLLGAVVHPNNLAATAALNSLRTAWPWLDDVEDATVHVPTNRAADTQRPARERPAGTDRTERRHTGAGASPAPLRVAVADTRALALRTITDCAWLCSSALSTIKGAPSYLGAWTGAPGTGGRWDIVTGYLGEAIPHITPELARTVGRDLERADRAVRRAAGEGPDHRPVHAPCPACGRRGTLTIDLNGNTIACTNTRCSCTGVDCGCKRPGRQPGQRHLWPATALPHLAQLAGRQIAA